MREEPLELLNEEKIVSGFRVKICRLERWIVGRGSSNRVCGIAAQQSLQALAGASEVVLYGARFGCDVKTTLVHKLASNFSPFTFC